MRGGDPTTLESGVIDDEVLPACAGVILYEIKLKIGGVGFTRMRGGDPRLMELVIGLMKFYPHARG